MPDPAQDVADLLEEYQKKVEAVASNAMNFWDRGMCDGLEVAAQLVEDSRWMNPALSTADVLAVLLGTIRQAQLRIQVDFPC